MYTGVLSMGMAAEYQEKKKENDKKAEALEKIANDIEKNINKPAEIKKIIKKLRFDAQQIINKR